MRYIQWAAFDLGRVHQRIKQREAATDGALARYEQTVLRALEETDASLTDYAKARVKQGHLQSSATASAEAATLARVRFDSGVADFLTVLDAERTMLEAEDQLAQSENPDGDRFAGNVQVAGRGLPTHRRTRFALEGALGKGLIPHTVTPAQAGVHLPIRMDSRLRGNDE